MVTPEPFGAFGGPAEMQLALRDTRPHDAMRPFGVDATFVRAFGIA
jgi:hypothetical protein